MSGPVVCLSMVVKLWLYTFVTMAFDPVFFRTCAIVICGLPGVSRTTFTGPLIPDRCQLESLGRRKSSETYNRGDDLVIEASPHERSVGARDDYVEGRSPAAQVEIDRARGVVQNGE